MLNNFKINCRVEIIKEYETDRDNYHWKRRSGRLDPQCSQLTSNKYCQHAEENGQSRKIMIE